MLFNPSIPDMVHMPLHSTATCNNQMEIVRVPGGWLYNSIQNETGDTTASVFVSITERMRGYTDE